ncbi:chitinase [Pseudoalteromonas rubra]|uniref:chitinase n=1 Tax=Pseudoalteromonas rubra TaxID=43658 RepID=A0A8T0C3Z8_9GAMM|nr:glycosyl hydrolase family 18 protein [Pseudoalteromonas rubra]KAF7782037.1 chitinase [Pseudoalteromonas rubra]
MKIKQISTAIGLALMSGSVLAAPSTPSLSWEPQVYSFVDVVLDGNGSYKDLVTAKDKVDIQIKWNAWSGTGGDSYKVYFDNQLVNEGTLTAGTKSGTITFPYMQSGRHTLYVELCDSTGCARSAGKEIVIADTDGGHLEPLPMDVNPNNRNNGTIPGKVTGAYFVEWGIYGRDFDVTNIPAQNLSHLLYGFIPICGANESLKEIENGNSWRALQKACAGTADYEVVIHDPWAAVQKTLPGVNQNDPIRGTYAQLMALKQRYPDLKILPSVGGWTLSDPFHGFTTKANRDVFVASMKKFLKTWKFYDGVDIDWEFPGGDGPNPDLGDPVNDGPAYIALMAELRAMLDELEAETGRTYELTSAIGSGYDKIEDVDYQAAQQYMDYIFAMTYDFYGGWNNVTGHQTGLYCGSHLSQDECNGTGLDDNGEPRKGPAYTAHNAVQLLLQQGVNSKKIVMGAAMYGRGWEGVLDQNTTIPGNPMTAPGNGKYAGSTSEGVWEPGIMDYKAIAANLVGPNGTGLNGFEVGYDDQAEAAYVWNRSNGKLLTFDSARSVEAKGRYVNLYDLGGLFAWEIDADNGDILNAMYDGLTGGVPVNKPPVVSVDSNVVMQSGGSITVTATASDPDNQPLTFAWSAPSALTLTNATTTAVGVAAPVVTQDTEYTLTIAVSDGAATTTRNVTVLVKAPSTGNDAPVVSPIAAVSLAENTSTSVQVSATDPNGDALTYTWSASNGLTVSGQGANATITAPEVTQDTTYQVTVAVSDGTATTTASFDVTVTDATVGADPWDRNKVYVGGDRVSYQGNLYEAKWWTRGEEPGKAMVWKAL